MLAALAAGCSRAPAGGDAARREAVDAPHVSASGVDADYVARILHATAADLAVCRQRVAMQGIAGADQEAGEAIVAIDSSGSMAGRSGAGTKMEEARAAVTQFVGALPAATRAGVLVFGDAGDNRPASKGASCAADPRFVFGPATVDRAAVASALAALHPAGWTPLAAAIRGASARFSGPPDARRTLFVVSDGAETCGGDPVAAARDAHGTGRVTVDVIGFCVGTPAEVAALRRVAAAGGGSYRDAAPGQLYLALKAQAAGAASANMGSVIHAETGMQQCYVAQIGRERDALMRRIDADQRAGRINQATHSALVSASSKRFDTDMADFLRVYNHNMNRANTARERMDDTVANATLVH